MLLQLSTLSLSFMINQVFMQIKSNPLSGLMRRVPFAQKLVHEFDGLLRLSIDENKKAVESDSSI